MSELSSDPAGAFGIRYNSIANIEWKNSLKTDLCRICILQTYGKVSVAGHNSLQLLREVDKIILVQDREYPSKPQNEITQKVCNVSGNGFQEIAITLSQS